MSKKKRDKNAVKSEKHENGVSAENSLKRRVEKFYDREYKKIAIIPTIIGIIAIIIILTQYFQTGEIIHRGISLKGGTTISINTNYEMSSDGLVSAFKKEFPKEEFNVRILRKQNVVDSVSIETSVSGSSVDRIVPIVEEVSGKSFTKNDYSIETIGSSLSESFFQEMIRILIFAFFLMGVVVFLYFKSPIPSFYVILCAFFDMVITLAVVNLLGIKINTAGIAAFLMLISFSIDTDMLLTARILRREDISPFDAALSALGTGMTMTATVLGAVVTAFFLTTSAEIKQIMTILIIGILVDVVVTWLQNASLCRWYVESRGK